MQQTSVPTVDPYLVDLVDYVNRSGERVSMRITVHGQTFTGFVIAATTWMSEQATDPVRAEGAEWLGVRLTEMARELQGVVIAGAEDADAAPRFLHLAEVMFAPGSEMPTTTGATWRFPLCAVDGWSLGLR